MINTETGLGDRPSPFIQTLARRVIGLWETIASTKHPVLTIVGVWAVLTVPLIFFRGYHSVEGLAVTIARTGLEDGDWLTPHMFNVRWVEKPTLLSWVIEAISLPFGQVNQLTARLPTVLSTLAGCLLIWRALRPFASTAAALFGPALFLACPAVYRYYAASLGDIPLAVILFAAFLLWWESFASGKTSFIRWLGIGVLLGLAALLKGPQPVGYFALGVGLFCLITSSWREIPGLILAGIVAAIPVALWYAYVFVPGDQGNWARYMRLSSEMATNVRPLRNVMAFFTNGLPAVLLAGAFLATRYRAPPETRLPPHFVLALACYALTCTVIIAFWPAEVAARYSFPMFPPLCVLGGIAYDTFVQKRPAILASVVALAVGILAFGVVYSTIAVPLMPQTYRDAQISGEKIRQVIDAKPAPIYRTEFAGLNAFAYIPNRLTEIDASEIGALPSPSWLAVPTKAADAAASKSSGQLRAVLSTPLQSAADIVARGNGRLRPVLEFDDMTLLRVE